jgi:hypothetical protein
MPVRTAIAALLIAAPVLSACGGNRAATEAAAAGPAICFKTTDVRSFQPISREAALVIVGDTRAFELRITGVCPDLNWSDRVVLSSEGDPATAATICTGAPVTVTTASPRGGFQDCYGNEILLAPPMNRPAGS